MLIQSRAAGSLVSDRKREVRGEAVEQDDFIKVHIHYFTFSLICFHENKEPQIPSSLSMMGVRSVASHSALVSSVQPYGYTAIFQLYRFPR
jgi:hypothetical protein